MILASSGNGAQMRDLIFKFCAGSVACLILLSCGGRESTYKGGSDDGGSEEELDSFSANFAIRPIWVRDDTSSALTTFVHRADSTDWSKGCYVEPTATANADKFITCIVEVHELDAYMHQIGFEYNSPGAQCDYLAVSPYWFWQYKPNMGPTSVEYTNNKDTNTQTLGTVVPANGSYATGVTLKATEQGKVPVCDFDYTLDEGPNCCQGSYSLTETIIEGGVTTSTTTRKTWGGKLGNCAVGPGTEWFKDEDDLPRVTYEPAYMGGKRQFKSKLAPITTPHKSVLYMANYHPNLAMAPAAITTGVLNKNGVLHSPQPYYQFTCMDKSEEAKARIRVLVRKWNLLSELLKGPSGDHTSTGAEGDPDYPGADKQDRDSWEEFAGQYPQKSL